MQRYAAIDNSLAHAVRNIRTLLSWATPEELEAGKHWYDAEREKLRGLAERTGLTLEQCCQVYAALSPNNRVDQNWLDARNVCFAATLANAGDVFDQVTVSTFYPNKVKAFRIALGEQNVLSGPKVVPFAANLAGDMSKVTIDRHAFNAACGCPYIIDKKGPTITEKRRKRAAGAYRVVAMREGLAPAELQAIIWLVWKRIIGR